MYQAENRGSVTIQYVSSTISKVFGISEIVNSKLTVTHRVFVHLFFMTLDHEQECYIKTASEYVYQINLKLKNT